MNNKKQILLDQLLDSINQENPETENYLVPEEVSRKARSLMSIKSDLGDAHYLIQQLSVMLLMHTGDGMIMTALWKAAIITYGKCFTSSDDGQGKLEAKECFKDIPYFIGAHNSLMSIRNGYIAHRGDNEFEETVLFVKIDKNHPEETTYAMKSFRAANSSFPNMVDYLNVIEHLQQFVEKRIKKNLQKIHDRLQSRENQ